MSFAGTPLGQGRRLDHSTFLGKPPPTGASALPSYAYSAPALGSRSPPKPRSETDDAQQQANSSADDPALVRFARLKQRESAAAAADKPGAPKLNTTPHPERWSVKDTSVNIATAFIQAASGNASMSHNTAWASSSRQPQPRSTSVEYEQSLTDLHKTRRLAPPPDKLGRGAPTVRKPVSKTASIRHVPSSDGEEEHVRGKSPFETGLNMAKQALDAATFFVRARSREPENTSGEQPTTNGHVSGNESSYSYTQEEAAFQAAQKQRNLAKKGRMSTDNKAYKPPQESEEESEYSDDGKTRRRKKTKKGPLGGPLNTLPVLSSDKRRKKKGTKGNTTGGHEEEEEEEEGTETDIVSPSRV
jgi:SUN domain-containing protein 1/2